MEVPTGGKFLGSTNLVDEVPYLLAELSVYRASGELRTLEDFNVVGAD